MNKKLQLATEQAWYLYKDWQIIPMEDRNNALLYLIHNWINGRGYKAVRLPSRPTQAAVRQICVDVIMDISFNKKPERIAA